MTNAFRSLARSLRDGLKPEIRSLSGKVSATLTGRSPISRSCQIAGLREMYAAIGLKPRDGQFVEIGAFDGEDFSNTSFLADQGWRGVYVEPVPLFAQRARRRHALNKVRIDQTAITEKPGAMTIHVMGALTTSDAGSVEALKSVAWAREQAEQSHAITVPCDTLSAVLGRNRVPNAFDLMVVDIEGAEKLVVDALLAGPWRPKVLIVELVDEHPNFTGMPKVRQSHREARTALADAGYSIFHTDEINTIFRLR